MTMSRVQLTCSTNTSRKFINTTRNLKLQKNLELVDFVPVNESFDDYLKCLSDPKSSEVEVQQSLDKYILERKKITKEAMVKDNKKWSDILKSYDAKAFWKRQHGHMGKLLTRQR